MIANKRRIIIFVSLASILALISGCTTSSTSTGNSLPAKSASSTKLRNGPPVILTNPLGPVTTLAWSPDGMELAASSGDIMSNDTNVRLWDKAGALMATLTGHTRPVTSLAWRPNGRTLVSGSRDNTVRFWDPNNLSSVTQITLPYPVYSLAWSPNGETLAIGMISFQPSSSSKDTPLLPLPGIVELRHADGTLLTTLSTQHTGGKFLNLAWSPDGTLIAAGAMDFQIWRADGSPIATFRPGGTPAWGMGWSPDGRTLATGDENGVVSLYSATGTLLGYSAGNGSITTLQWSPGGDSIAVSSNAGARLVHVADPSTYPQVVYTRAAVSAAWSADGQSLIIGASDRTIRVWSVTEQTLFPVDGCAGVAQVVAWSLNSSAVAAGMENNVICLWTDHVA